MKIKNKNFISPRMNKHDLQGCFDVGEESIHTAVYEELIPDGWIKKFNERYYRPTEQLLNAAFIPESGIVTLTDEQERFLAYNTTFTRRDLIALFDDNEQIVKQMIQTGLLKLERTGTFRKSTGFEEDLSDGENEFTITP